LELAIKPLQISYQKKEQSFTISEILNFKKRWASKIIVTELEL
jgi:hypothetical protein